mgnify:CR=1 FL=1|jgi:hypothetical protein|nr:hypothetical protein [uncultured Mediterranean phage uvMED]|tara:strand:- start:8 stop:286 length:279 start_codon:yes stop_codon:yes gene_type:complete
MKESINLKEDKEVKYLCSWNSNDIVQIHTKETLWNEYKDSNLFDDDDDMLFETLGNGFDNFKIKDYLKLSSEDDDFLNVNFICDNMEIKRIV